MKKGLLLLSLLAALAPGMAFASDAVVEQAIKKLGFEQATVQPSPLTGISTVMTEDNVLYISDDGKHLLVGQLYDISGTQPINVTHQMLLGQMEKLQDEMIVYRAPQEKYVVTIFTDITCGYCRKLHEQMSEYNAQGITIRYLAFPRQGMQSQTAKEMQSIWCHADRNQAFDNAMKGEKISPASCKTDITRHHQLGAQFNIQGTPAMVLSDGTLIPGYQEPKELLASLEQHQTQLKSGG